MFSKNRTTEISGRKDLTKNGKKLYCVFTEYIKYPFIYVWAADAENATVWAKQQPTEAFFDFPERPLKWPRNLAFAAQGTRRQGRDQ